MTPTVQLTARDEAAQGDWGMLSKEPLPPGQQLEDQIIRYRMVLTKEAASHKLFSRITLVTGLGLLLTGIVGTYYYAPLGWLLCPRRRPPHVEHRI
jgi:preprotein translocase subunit Sss1